MKTLSQKQQLELNHWLTDNIHEKMTAKEGFTEIHTSGFSDDEVKHLIGQVIYNDSFKFKEPAAPKPDSLKKLETYVLVSRNKEDYSITTAIFAIVDDKYYSQNDRKELDAFSINNPDKEILSFNLDCVSEIESIDFFKHLYLSEIEPLETVYYREQHYGGAEEGGWYYHTLRATTYKKHEVEIGLNKFGEGYLVYKEFIYGQNEDTTRQVYC